jgi:hypothetical protein
LKLTAINQAKEELYGNISVIYEDFSEVEGEEKHVNTESSFSLHGETSILNFAPFHFSVCSYKHSGKKFRIIIQIFKKQNNIHALSLISPSFLIKAKKPISKPGIKSLKRKVEENQFEVQEKKIKISKPYIKREQNNQSNNFTPVEIFDKFLNSQEKIQMDSMDYIFDFSKCNDIIASVKNMKTEDQNDVFGSLIEQYSDFDVLKDFDESSYFL